MMFSETDENYNLHFQKKKCVQMNTNQYLQNLYINI